LGPGIPDRVQQGPPVSKQAAQLSSISHVTAKPILGGCITSMDGQTPPELLDEIIAEYNSAMTIFWIWTIGTGA
jgi:hypothetical protein